MKTYRYRKHIRWMKFVIPAFLVMLAACFILPLFVSRRVDAEFDSVLIGLNVFILIEAWVIWRIFDRLSRVEVSLNEEGIAYHGKKGLVEIPFEEITEIKHPSVRYLGGWLKVRAGAKDIRLTVVLEGIGDFVGELKSSLDRLGFSDRYQRAKLFRFYKTAEYADQSWARVYEFFWKLMMWMALSGVVGALIGYFHVEGRNRSLAVTFWALGSLVWCLVAYMFSEMMLARRFARQANEAEFAVPARDPEVERRVFTRAIRIAAPLYVVIAALIFLL